ncbi:MAG: GntR family transcriptional regulator [Pseudomonadota bacterium]
MHDRQAAAIGQENENSAQLWAAATLSEAIPVSQAGPRLIREQALDKVRSAIVEGRLKPGARLTERELCAELSISRTIVREIVRQLEAERLVEVVPHCGLRVPHLTPKLVREIYDIRVELEVLVVRAFLEVADDAQIDKLRGHFAAVVAATKTGDMAVMVAAITTFLRYMIAVADHQVASEVLQQQLARINMLRILSMSQPGRIEASLLEIEKLVDRIAARDHAGAEWATRIYVQAAGAAALAQLDTQESDQGKS